MNTCAFRRLIWPASGLVLLCGSCSNHERDEPTGVDTSAIINGVPVPSPEDTGHVRVVTKSSAGTFTATGSGTLLDNLVALGSAHTLNDSNCPVKAGAQGNESFDCYFRPNSHLMSIGNDPPIMVANASRISVHPG